VLGSETELIERYNVSRAVFREAVRIVEHQQVVRARRGPSGGLVVTEPTVGAVIDAVTLYLHRVDARLDEVFEARIALEEIATALAATRLGEDHRRDLEAFVERGEDADRDPRSLHGLIASATGNAALELFVEVLIRVGRLYLPDVRRRRSAAPEMAFAHAQIARAVIAGDPELAARRMQRHLEASAEFLRTQRSTYQVLPESVILSGSTGKGAEAVARDIIRTILAKGFQPGELVGTEPELIEREGVSRALLREAVRLLEHHQIAAMRRGVGGGLFVVEPSSSAVTDIAAIYLARRGMPLIQLAELRVGVEECIAGLAATRVDADGVARMNQALDNEATNSYHADRADAGYDLHATIASVAQNRVLELMSLVLIRLARLHQIERLTNTAEERVGREVFHAHNAIAEAVASGDAGRATHRMRRHLEALTDALR
jgi:DNA-binding FadR family transcriptional regulator